MRVGGAAEVSEEGRRCFVILDTRRAATARKCRKRFGPSFECQRDREKIETLPMCLDVPSHITHVLRYSRSGAFGMMFLFWRTARKDGGAAVRPMTKPGVNVALPYINPLRVRGLWFTWSFGCLATIL